MIKSTARQIKAVQTLSESIRTGGTKGKALLDAGYSKEVSLKPKLVTESEGFKEAAEPFVKQMEKERQRLINSMMTKNLDEVGYADHTRALDTLTKNVQLLSGKPTERIGMLSSLFDRSEEEEQ